MSTVEQFEVIIIGGGKAGKTLAVDLGKYGVKTALIERDAAMIGGTCINVACIPTKSFIECAKVAASARHASTYGVSTGPVAVDWASVRKRVEEVVVGMRTMQHTLFKSAASLDFILGEAKFISPQEIEVRGNDATTRTLTAPKIFINTGTRPSTLTVAGLDEEDILTSNTVQKIDELPGHLVIVGAGYVAIEFAQIFRRLGSVVTVIARGPHILPNEEPEIADALTAILRSEGVEIHLNSSVVSGKGRGEALVLNVKGASEEIPVVGTHLLAATGRSSVVEALNLNAAGIKTDMRGFIEVNDRLETNMPGIWALGDCNGGPQFTHASLDDYRIVKANVFSGGIRSTTDRIIPSSLYTDPELARVGLTEREARAASLGIRVVVVPTSVIPRAKTSGHTAGLMKAVVDSATGEILGASLLATSAGEMISTVQMAMLAKLPYTVLRDAVLTHPTMTEGLNYLFAGT